MTRLLTMIYRLVSMSEELGVHRFKYPSTTNTETGRLRLEREMLLKDIETEIRNIDFKLEDF